MKATIEYNLDDHGEGKAHLRAIKSTEMALVLWEIRNNLFNELESEIEANKGGQKAVRYDQLNQVYKKITELMEFHNINLDELID